MKMMDPASLLCGSALHCIIDLPYLDSLLDKHGAESILICTMALNTGMRLANIRVAILKAMGKLA